MRHEKSSHRADCRIGDSLMNNLLWSILLALIFGLGITVLVLFGLYKCGVSTPWGNILAIACGWGAWLIFGKRVLSLFGLDKFPKKADE